MSDGEKPQEQSQEDRFKEALKVHEGKTFSKHYDPCQEAADRSIKCIHRNPGQKDLCNDYFQAYRDCKKAWTEAQRKAKSERMGGWFG